MSINQLNDALIERLLYILLLLVLLVNVYMGLVAISTNHKVDQSIKANNCLVSQFITGKIPTQAQLDSCTK